MGNFIVVADGVAFIIDVGGNTDISQVVTFGDVLENVFEARLSNSFYYLLYLFFSKASCLSRP